MMLTRERELAYSTRFAGNRKVILGEGLARQRIGLLLKGFENRMLIGDKG
jgi:hypothetical protein